ncbi:hypothetical protein AZE42_12106 [Rhizopogon vesiculosus]|uniref:F-box domain-containing protein n=1 Tax=Rhizopogon vesiculosus TaxID=180088 RepID=A0A1J8QDU3_9AGAM|nr:hypothetical protein AZE42_12106 [Rhizopogon vesiculosus]
MTINGFGTDNLLGRDNPNFAPFLNLAALYLSLSTLHFVTATNFTTFIQHSEFPSLKEFKLQVLHDSYGPQAERIIGALSQHKACQILEHVEISFCNPEPLEYLGNPLPVIRQFLPFTQLRYLQLDVGPLCLDNDLLLEAIEV